MFDLDQFIAECRTCVTERTPQAVRELVARAVSDPTALIAAIGEPQRPQMQTLYHAPDLTILNLAWAPKMTVMPHNHRLWAVIGIYGGREDNIFWRRVPGGGDGRIEAAGAKSLATGNVELLGRDIIHSVTNPTPRLTGAIHVYGGDFFNISRSQWDPEALQEETYDVQRAMKEFG